jgi:hypothetical protein
VTTTVVIGFGVTGRAVVAHLAPAGEVVVVDDRPAEDSPAVAASLGAILVVRPDAQQLSALLRRAGQVVPSPGVPAGHPALAAAAAAGVPVRSEIELAWARLAARPEPRPRLVAVTGTNGKTTVTTAVADLLAASGVVAVTGGNIGTPLVDAVAADAEVVIAEVSSFQLHHTERWHPSVSCWLNLAADHLDWHPDTAHYAAAKERIWANQGPGDTAVVSADDPVVSAAASRLASGVRVVTFGTGASVDYRDASPEGASQDPALLRLVGPDGSDLLLGGRLARSLPHDRTNALAAHPRVSPPGWWRGARSRIESSSSPSAPVSGGTTTRRPPLLLRCLPPPPACGRSCSSPAVATRASTSACWLLRRLRSTTWSPSVRRPARWPLPSTAWCRSTRPLTCPVPSPWRTALPPPVTPWCSPLDAPASTGTAPTPSGVTTSPASCAP